MTTEAQGAEERGSVPAEAAPVGRMVNNRDVVECASRKCRACFGRGTIAVRPVGGERYERNCGCAMRRFVTIHRADIEEVPTEKPGVVNLRWLPGREPESKAA
jgi:hypothetical protein